jgi:hypothetical protein
MKDISGVLGQQDDALNRNKTEVLHPDRRPVAAQVSAICAEQDGELTV